MKTLHKVIRWGLGIHGLFHILEFVMNLIEGAWISAIITLIGAFFMLGGVYIDYTHHSGGDKNERA